MKNILLFCLFLLLSLPNSFAEIEHEQHELVYIDPLMVEHAFLENKLRFDFGYQNRSDFERQDQPLNEEGETTQEGVANIASYSLLLEWMLSERLGVGIETSLLQVDAFDQSNTVGFGDTEVELKYIPWMDLENKFVSALSFGVGIPTGNEDYGLGEGRVELEPSFLLFKKVGGLVIQGQYVFSLELGSGQDPAFLKYNHSFSYPFELENIKMIHSFIPIFEVLGTVPLNGEEEGKSQLSFMPGGRVNFQYDLSVGCGVKFPVGRHSDNEVEALVTISKHFD